MGLAMNDVGDSINDELDLDRWLEEQSQEARQVREDADEAVWHVLQTYGDPVADEVHTAAVENLIGAHHTARNAGETTDVFADFGLSAWNAISAVLPRPRMVSALPVQTLLARAGQQGQRTSRARRSTKIRGARAPGRSDDPEPPLGRTGRLPGGSR